MNDRDEPARTRAFAAVYEYLRDHPGEVPTGDHLRGFVFGAVAAALDAYERRE